MEMYKIEDKFILEINKAERKAFLFALNRFYKILKDHDETGEVTELVSDMIKEMEWIKC